MSRHLGDSTSWERSVLRSETEEWGRQVAAIARILRTSS
jgi:hypothetical protein